MAEKPGLAMERNEKLYIAFVWLGALLLLCFVIWMGYSLNSSVKAENERSFVRNMGYLAESSAKSIQIHFENITSELVLLTQLDVIKRNDLQWADIVFQQEIKKYHERISHMILLNGLGQVSLMITKDPAPATLMPHVKEFFDKTMPGKGKQPVLVNISENLIVTPTFRGLGVGTPIFQKVEAQAPGRARPSSIFATGMIMALLGADDLVGELLEPVRLEESGFAWLAVGGGDILANKKRMETFLRGAYGPQGTTAKLQADFSKVIKGAAAPGWTRLEGEKLSFRTALGGDEWFVSVAQTEIRDQKWTVAVAAPSSEAARLLNQSFWQSVLLLALVALILFLGGSLITQAERRLIRAEERALHAAELERKNIALEELNRRMDEFVAVVSHDIRSPLNVIRGFIKLIRSAPEGSAFERETSTMLRSSNRLLQLVNDILDVSKLEQGAARLAYDPITLDNIIEESVKTMEFAALEKEQDIRMDLGEKTAMDADEAKLLQVMNNLIGNAIKFTPRGGNITVTKRTENGAAIIMVSDTGPGIPPEEQSAVFEKFEQLKMSQQGVEPGSGLGLAICKGYVELHRGNIRVTSNAGQGSTFHVSLPLKRPGREEKNAPGSTSASGVS
ncbi:MAG: sensor histidine kinase [Nitrospinae bacterium]|nr:sensor histidine kinase [Nitrospinota bacterium]